MGLFCRERPMNISHPVEAKWMAHGIAVFFRKFSVHHSPRKIVPSRAVSITRLNEKGGNRQVQSTPSCARAHMRRKGEDGVGNYDNAFVPVPAAVDSARFSVWLHNKISLLIASIFLRLSFREKY